MGSKIANYLLVLKTHFQFLNAIKWFCNLDKIAEEWEIIIWVLEFRPSKKAPHNISDALRSWPQLMIFLSHLHTLRQYFSLVSQKCVLDRNYLPNHSLFLPSNNQYYIFVQLAVTCKVSLQPLHTEDLDLRFEVLWWTLGHKLGHIFWE